MTTATLFALDDSQIDASSLIDSTVRKFKQVTRHYALFHIGFYSLAFLELVAFVLFFSFFTQTAMFAFSLAGLLFTVFTYFVLLFYLQAKKPQELTDILTQFTMSSLQFSSSEQHPSIVRVHALHQLLSALRSQEYTYYGALRSPQTFSPLLQRFSAWVHWKDLHKMNEAILIQMIEEHFQIVKHYPTDQELHMSLAQSYQLLAELYTDPTRLSSTNLPWVSPEYNTSSFQKSRQTALKKALEEYKILDHYSPKNSQIYRQLARIYYDLEDYDLAISAYEEITSQHPEDIDALFDLGTLYFEHGKYAQGLQLYEQLKALEYEGCDVLLSYYTQTT